jgi:hypothetical protein
MSCQLCKSNRVINVNAKCSDCCSVQLGNSEVDGYVPKDLGIGGGDYIEFSLCLQCGQLQGNFPIAVAEIEKDITNEQVVEFFNNYFVEGTHLHFNKSAYFMQRNIINAAEEVSSKFGLFIRKYFEYNVGCTPAHKHPPAEQFVQMFRNQDYDLGYE